MSTLTHMHTHTFWGLYYINNMIVMYLLFSDKIKKLPSKLLKCPNLDIKP